MVIVGRRMFERWECGLKRRVWLRKIIDVELCGLNCEDERATEAGKQI